jgi:hypothetical protein
MKLHNWCQVFRKVAVCSTLSTNIVNALNVVFYNKLLICAADDVVFVSGTRVTVLPPFTGDFFTGFSLIYRLRKRIPKMTR